MASTPTPRSYQQILGEMFAAFIAANGGTPPKARSALAFIMQAAARSDLRSSQDIFGLLQSITLDDATGLALRRTGDDESVPILEPLAATGLVNITDTSFTKISTRVFQGKPAPIIGSNQIFVEDASLIPGGSTIYISRGSINYEGPLSVLGGVDNGTYWTLTLASPTVRFHNVADEVVLAMRGNRSINQSSVVKTTLGGLADAVEFKVVYGANIPDGETSVSGVSVIAKKTGEVGNVPAASIIEFSSPPFPGATVTNPLPFRTGREIEDDDHYRERIRAVRASRSQGIPLAITTAVTGITSPDENKRVNSASLIVRSGSPSSLYIDDGNGYEEISEGVPIESPIDSAIGGEQYLQTIQRPVAKAFVESSNVAPFAIEDGARLAVSVGGVLYVHRFQGTDFTAPANAAAFEVIASINANVDLGFGARTSDSGNKVVLFAKEEVNDDLIVEVPVDGIDSNLAFQFGTSQVFTMRLYKNDRLLNKDGLKAIYKSKEFSEWDTISGSPTIQIAIDGTPGQTYTFVDQNFIDTNTGFTTVGKNSVAAWVAVIDAKIPGVTATEEAGRITLTSNAGTVLKAEIEILGGSLVVSRMFDLGGAIGAPRDYDLDRNYGQVRLQKAANPGDSVTIGSKNTRAFIESDVIPTTDLASDAKIWFVVDGDAKILAHGVSPSTLITITMLGVHDWGYRIKFEAPTTAFTNVKIGDWLVLWDAALNPSLLGAHRISEVDPVFEWVVLERKNAENARTKHASVAMVPADGSISKVLTTGGLMGFTITNPGIRSQINGATDSCEIFNPNTNTVSYAATMGWRRAAHTATALQNGKVFVAGGVQDGGVYLASTEIYDPATDIWTPGPSMPQGVSHHTATLLANGNVFLCGGTYIDNTGADVVYDGCSLYDPAGGGSLTNLSPGVTLQEGKANHKAVLLPSGNVLIVGGEDIAETALSSVDIYNPSGNTIAAKAPMSNGRRDFGLAIAGGSAMALGGDYRDSFGEDSWEAYNDIANTWSTAISIGSNICFSNQDLVTLQNGKVVALQCYDSVTKARSAYSFLTGVWTAINPSPLNDDAYTHLDRQNVLLFKNDASYLNHAVTIGGRSIISWLPTANLEKYDGNLSGDASWSWPELSVGNDILLSQRGLAFVRTLAPIQDITIPTGTNYTATSIAASLNSSLRGATASVYRTNQYRVRTNSFAIDGDIAIVAQNPAAAALGVDSADAITNLTGHLASVESSSSEFGTPDFMEHLVLGSKKNTNGAIADVLSVSGADVDAGHGIVGLRNPWIGRGAPNFHQRYGSNFGYLGEIHSLIQDTETATVNTRVKAIQPWIPLDRFYLAAPFAIGPQDDLTVEIDGDSNKRFSIEMSRQLKPFTSSYGNTNTFVDAENANVTLATAFGLGYDFNDFAVYMRARAIAYSSDSSKKAIIRYTRFGSDGNNVQVRISNPVGANTQTSVKIENEEFEFLNNALVTVNLPGGAPKAQTITNATRIGHAIQNGTANDNNYANVVVLLGFSVTSASRTSNVTSLTLALPGGISDCGLSVGSKIWTQSTDSNFFSGRYTITFVGTASGVGGTQVVRYIETAADQGATANIGTVSNNDTGEMLFSGVIAGDFLRINPLSPVTGIQDFTFAVNAVAPQYLVVTSGDMFVGSPDDGTITWDSIGQISYLEIFANTNKTMTQLVADVNAGAALANTTWPITMTVIGTGSGVIALGTSDELASYSAYYALTDGMNWVSTTTSPGSISGNYQLTFKVSVNGALSTGSDWINEKLYIAPITAKTIVKWLNTAAVSGLFTAATIEQSFDGTKVQILSNTPGSDGSVEVQGGLGNSMTANAISSQTITTTIAKSDANGLAGGMWCRIQNQTGLPKASVFINSGTQLVSWSSDGLIEVNVAVYSEANAPIQGRMVWEKQGRLIAISDLGTLNPSGVDVFSAIAYNSIREGSFIRVTPPGSPVIGFEEVPAQNQGIFRVIKIQRPGEIPGTAGILWIEAPGTVEGTFDCTIGSYFTESIMPGDHLVINTDAWGPANRGTWTIEKVGVPTGGSSAEFTVDTKFKVSVNDRTPQAIGGVAALGLEAEKIQIVEAKPITLYKKVIGICPNNDDGSKLDIRWDSKQQIPTVSAVSASVITPIDKLSFPLGLNVGLDGYRYNTGLIGEANRVIYGVATDKATYPGVAATGAQIGIYGPRVRRIQLALQLRIKSGVSTADIASRVRSAVASYVNGIGLRDPVPISGIISAAMSVPGVSSVAVITPDYSIGSDVISLQPYEKPLIQNLEQDIQITFAGE